MTIIYEVQDKIIKNSDTLKEHTLIPIGSTAYVMRGDSRPLTYGTVTNNSDSDHSGKSYRIQITKTDRIMTRTARNGKTTLIFA